MGRIAYNSLTPVLTADYDEQSSINGMRMVYSIARSLGAVVLGTLLGWIFGDDGGRLFLTLGIVLSALITVPPLIVTRVTKGRDSSHPGEQPPSWEAVRATFANRPFRIVMGIYLTSWTAVSLVAANLVYYARYNLGIPDQANYFVLVAQGIALLFIPVIVAAARRWDKRSALFLGFGSMVPVLAAIAAVPAKWLGNAAPAVGRRSEPKLPSDGPNLDVPDADALVPPRTGVAHGRR